MNEKTIAAWRKEPLADCLNEALADLFRVDRYLLKSGARENTVVSRLACHLSHKLEPEFRSGDGGAESLELPDYRVDVEYQNDRNEKSKEFTAYLEGILKVSSGRPDLIVHERGENVANLLVIEVKKRRYRKPFDLARAAEARLKLLAYVSGTLQYKYGLYLEFQTYKSRCEVSAAKLISRTVSFKHWGRGFRDLVSDTESDWRDLGTDGSGVTQGKRALSTLRRLEKECGFAPIADLIQPPREYCSF